MFEHMFSLAVGLCLSSMNKLGDIHESFSNVYNECEQLMLACYGTQKSATMSAARYGLWLSKLSKKTASAAPLTKAPPTNIRSFQRACKKNTPNWSSNSSF